MTLQLAANFAAVLGRYDNIKQKADKEKLLKLQLLKENIELTKSEISTAMDNFNNVREPKLIDFYIYKIQSEQNRYAQLIMEYKELERAANTSLNK